MTVNKKIYFFTRSYIPEFQGGGAIVRDQTVQLLRDNGYDVKIVLFTFNEDMWIDSPDVIPIPIERKWMRFCTALEHLGVLDDYLSPWVKNSALKLSKIINSNDLLFATSGGELGCIQLAVKLKEMTGAKLLVNLHDPIDYTSVMGMTIPGRLHVNRNKVTIQYLSKSDAIVTSSKYYADDLKAKLNNNIVIRNWYFGFFGQPVSFTKKNKSGDNFNLVYAGNMNNIQRPQIIIEALIDSDIFNKINFHFFGSGLNSLIIKSYSDKYENVYFYGQKSQCEIHDFYLKYADAGFIPLIGDYFKPFVPSKLYDYIKFGLPSLGFLPDGDARNIINDNLLGCAVGEFNEISQVLETWINDKSSYYEIKNSIEDRKLSWSIYNTSTSLLETIKEIQS
jgi:hypothetical protein